MRKSAVMSSLEILNNLSKQKKTTREVKEAITTATQFIQNVYQKKEKAAAARSAAFQAKRHFRLTYRTSGEEIIVHTLEAVAEKVGRTVGTIRAYLGQNGGKAHFPLEDDVITVEKETLQ